MNAKQTTSKRNMFFKMKRLKDDNNYLRQKNDVLERKIKALEEHRDASNELIATQRQLIAAKDEKVIVLEKLIASYEVQLGIRKD